MTHSTNVLGTHMKDLLNADDDNLPWKMKLNFLLIK